MLCLKGIDVCRQQRLPLLLLLLLLLGGNWPNASLPELVSRELKEQVSASLALQGI
jgi:hypothetical protein